MKILNLTQHAATPDQVAAGVVDVTPEYRSELIAALTFEALPGKREIERRAAFLAEFAATYDLSESDDTEGVYPEAAMIGGAPFLMAALEAELRDRFVQPLYAFSVRESVEKTQDDGSVQKTNVFRHAGFVEL